MPIGAHVGFESGWASEQRSRCTAAPGVAERLYGVVDELHTLFPERAFTPDGHLVGDIGESVAAYLFGLELNAPSTEGHDGLVPPAEGATTTGRPVTVEIKCTQRTSVAFYESDVELDQLLVLRLHRAAEPEIVYNGPADKILELLRAKSLPKNGQRKLSLNQLRSLDQAVLEADRIRQVRSFEDGTWKRP